MENTAQSLLEQAGKCVDQSGADVLLDVLRQAFLAIPSFGGLVIANDEAYLESGGPLVRFEASQVISNHYIAMLRPEIREGAFSVYVVLNHMKDGYGIQSQSWELADDEFEDYVHSGADTTVEELARKAVAMATRFQASLLERLGVSKQDALEVCRKNWKGAEAC